jgi:hypothetical protein
VVKTRALHITSLSCSKAFVASGVHENASFLVSAIKGVGVRNHSWIAAGAEPNTHQFKCHDLLIEGDEWK